MKKMGRVVRRRKLHQRTDLTFADLARMINPVVCGDALLPCLLPHRAYTPSGAHQYLPVALDPQEVSPLSRPEKRVSGLVCCRRQSRSDILG